MNKEVIDWLYDAASKKNKDFKGKFPTTESFYDHINEASNDIEFKTEILDWLYNAASKKNEAFRGKYPTLNKFHRSLGIMTYSDEEIGSLKKVAKEGLSNLYKGGLDKLLRNRDQLLPMLEEAKIQRSQYNGADAEYIKQDKRVRNLEKAIGLVDAYDAIENANTYKEVSALIRGEIPGKTDIDQPSESPFLKQVMPSAEYKTFELKGEKPGGIKGFFPEATRRAEQGAGAVGTAIGGLKDVMRLPGRAVRPFAKDIVGTSDPNISYWEEFARPDKYKTGAEEIFDEVAGLQGVGGALTRKAGLAGAKAFPRVARGLDKLLGFNKARDIVYRGVKGGEEALDILGSPGSSMTKTALRGIGKELPSIGLDVGYEATRSADEQSNPLLVGVGGVAGAGLSPFIKGGFSKLGDWVRGTDDVTRELLSKSKLQDELSLARALMDPKEASSVSGLSKLAEAAEALPASRSVLANERAALADELSALRTRAGDRAGAEMMREVDLSNPFGFHEAMAPQAPKFSLFDEPQYQYLEEISKRHPSTHKRLLNEIALERGSLPSVENILQTAQSVSLQNPKLQGLIRPYLKQISEAKNSAEAYKILTEMRDEVRGIDFSGVGSPLPPEFDLQSAMDTRTKFREYGGGAFGTNKSVMQEAEKIQKSVMDKQLQSPSIIEGISETLGSDDVSRKLKELGSGIQEKYKELAKNFGLEDELESALSSGQKADALLSKIGSARISLAERGNAFADFVDLQNRLNKASGKKVDFITPAVLRRLESKKFWEDVLGTPSLAAKALKIVGDLGVESLTSGKVRSLFAQIENLRQGDEVRERQRELPTRSKSEALKSQVSEAERRWSEYVAEARKKEEANKGK